MNTDNSFWKSVRVVLTGTAITQAIPILGSLIIARLYLPDDYGALSIWLGFVIFFAVLSTGRYEMSLALEKDGRFRVLGVLSNLLMIFGVSILFSVFLVWGFFFEIFQDSNKILFIFIIPCGALFGISSVYQAWAAADGKFYELSKMRVIQAFLITVIQVME